MFASGPLVQSIACLKFDVLRDHVLLPGCPLTETAGFALHCEHLTLMASKLKSEGQIGYVLGLFLEAIPFELWWKGADTQS